MPEYCNRLSPCNFSDLQDHPRPVYLIVSYYHTEYVDFPVPGVYPISLIVALAISPRASQKKCAL